MKTKWALIVLILAGLSGAAASGQSLLFAETEYYIVDLGSSAITADALLARVQSEGMSTIVYAGGGVVATRGGAETDASPDKVASDPAVLVVDGERYSLRIEQDSYVYTVRPAAAGIELVIGTTGDLPVASVLGEILTSLQDLGVVGADVGIEYVAYDRNALKGPASPDGAALESTLYGLTVAEDWGAYARVKGITLVGLRADVVVEKLPGQVLPEEFRAFLVTETEQLAKLLLPVDLMVSLAKSSAVGYVRLPYQPAIP